jgi:hypothetical protein
MEALAEAGDPSWLVHDALPSRSPHCHLTGLHPNTPYAIRVASQTPAGSSDFCPVAIFSTAASPPPPSPVPKVAESTATSVVLQWVSAVDMGRSGLRSVVYDAQCAYLGFDGASSVPPRAWLPVYHGTCLTCSVCDLKPSCHYAFRLRAIDGKAVGTWGAEVMAVTASAAPAAPAAVVCTSRSPTALHLAWSDEATGCTSPMSFQCAPRCMLLVASTEHIAEWLAGSPESALC